MTRDPRSDPKVPADPWVDRPMTAQELADVKLRLSKMTDAHLVKFYESSIQMCRLDRGLPPRAAFTSPR